MAQGSPIGADQAESIARAIHQQPETALEESMAADRCQDFLKKRGFDVQSGVAGMTTAFVGVASVGSGVGPTLGLIAEYDALPGVGHGCAHHLVAGAALEAAARIQDCGHSGRLQVFGTPAEEVGIGKVRMLESGVFAGTDAILAYHPSDLEAVWGRNNGAWTTSVVFAGQPSHAASRPWDGRSAQDGAELLLHGLALERLYQRDGTRIHAIVERVDGSHNVLPSEASVRVNIRAPEVSRLTDLQSRIETIATAAAAASATSVSITPDPALMPYLMDQRLAALAWEVMGLPDGTVYNFGGSSDLGNVSQEIPTVCVTTGGWPPATWHSSALHDASGTDTAYESMHRAAGHLTELATRLYRDGLPWA